MSTIISSIFFFILALGILITFHEFGHYWVARKLGIKVLRFSVGFGKPLWSKRGGPDDTEYVLAAIPLGGYVKMLDERDCEDIPAHEVHRAFNRQTLWKRTAVVVAGPFANFILAIFAYWLIFVIGVTGMKPIVGAVEAESMADQGGLRNGDLILSVDDIETPTWESAVVEMLDKGLDSDGFTLNVIDADSGQTVQKFLPVHAMPDDLNKGGLLDFIGIRPSRPNIPPVIGRLAPGGPAERAGLEGEDLIVEADGQAINDWEAWVDYVRARPGQTIDLLIERGAERLSLQLTPEAYETNEGVIGRIGASVQLQEMPDELKATVKHGAGESVWLAVVKTWDMSALTLKMLGKMVMGEISLSNLSGPISIARYAGYSASIGFVSFLTFLAVVSISLGVLNLLPIPMLDGGHLMYYAAEAVKGSPVSEATQVIGYKIGVALLVCMMVLAFYNDILRLIPS